MTLAVVTDRLQKTPLPAQLTLKKVERKKNPLISEVMSWNEYSGIPNNNNRRGYWLSKEFAPRWKELQDAEWDQEHSNQSRFSKTNNGFADDLKMKMELDLTFFDVQRQVRKIQSHIESLSIGITILFFGLLARELFPPNRYLEVLRGNRNTFQVLGI